MPSPGVGEATWADKRLVIVITQIMCLHAAMLVLTVLEFVTAQVVQQVTQIPKGLMSFLVKNENCNIQVFPCCYSEPKCSITVYNEPLMLQKNA